MFGSPMKRTHEKSKIIFVEWGFSTCRELLYQEKATYRGNEVVLLQVMPVYFEETSGSYAERGCFVEFVYKSDFEDSSFKELLM